MTKYEAFHSGKFEQLHVHSVATGMHTGTLWAQGWIIYKRFPHELPITEDFQFKIPVETRDLVEVGDI